MEPEQRILQVAFDLFTRFGVRNVTMDDISRDLGMSKKTLYQCFSDKAALVLACVEGFFQREACISVEIEQQSENAVHEQVLIMNWLEQNFHYTSPSMIFEMQRYYPAAWQLFDKHRRENALKAIIRNLERGISEGLYRRELNVELTARLRVLSYSNPGDPTILPPERYSFVQIQSTLLESYLYSITTPAGIERYLQYRKKPA
jgi:TetR/AcrR family transcriptional regulator, cholesterol catabolism regulator